VVGPHGHVTRNDQCTVLGILGAHGTNDDSNPYYRHHLLSDSHCAYKKKGDVSVRTRVAERSGARFNESGWLGRYFNTSPRQNHWPRSCCSLSLLSFYSLTLIVGASWLQAVGVVAREILFSPNAHGYAGRQGRERFIVAWGLSLCLPACLPARTAFLLWLDYARLLLRDTELCLRTFFVSFIRCVLASASPAALQQGRSRFRRSFARGTRRRLPACYDTR
jgi:hypothetical protein